MVAFLLQSHSKDDIYHAGDFLIAGVLCTTVALGYAALILVLRRKKAFRGLSYGFRLLLGSGIAMIALAFVLDALNPVVEHAILP